MMKNVFWMFSILLMIITVLSSLGGGIRYRENFLEEVFDLNDITSDIEMIPFESQPAMVSEYVEEEKKVEPIEVKREEPKEVNIPTTLPFQSIEPYTGELYASY